MNKIVISHPLYRDGMALLEGKAEIVITNDGDSDRILDSLIDADAYILREDRQKSDRALRGAEGDHPPRCGV